LTKRKGLDQVLHLIAADKNLAYVIIGNGKELTYQKQLSKKNKISDRCQFCGFRSNASVYLRYFDFFVMPSRSEGFGLALVEAVQQKVPVVCSDLQVFKELFNDDEVTFFKLGDQKSLSEALKSAIATGQKKAGKAYISYLHNFTAKTMAQKYYELYKSA
jgi:glycosyltransferase involved in cell wall biosynthesis